MLLKVDRPRGWSPVAGDRVGHCITQSGLRFIRQSNRHDDSTSRVFYIGLVLTP
jgi:hypothetical protein